MGRSGRKSEPVWTMVTPVIYGLLIPFTGTSLGAACVFFLKNGLGDRVQWRLTGFASGVMVAATPHNSPKGMAIGVVYQKLRGPSIRPAHRLLVRLADGLLKLQIVRMVFRKEERRI